MKLNRHYFVKNSTHFFTKIKKIYTTQDTGQATGQDEKIDFCAELIRCKISMKVSKRQPKHTLTDKKAFSRFVLRGKALIILA